MADGGGTGRIELGFARAPDGPSFLARQRVAYPFNVTRTHAYDGDPGGMATLVLQSVGGGLVEGDALTLAIDCAADAHAHVTTQAATVAHRMPGRPARLSQSLTAAAGAWLEYLPDPVILFPGADVTVTTAIALDRAATLILADGFFGHAPAGGEPNMELAPGRIAGRLDVRWPDGARAFTDNYDAGAECLGPHQPGGARAVGTVVVCAPRAADALADAMVAALAAVPDVTAGASTLPGDAGAWARVLAKDGWALRAATTAAWVAARVVLAGTAPLPRRK